MNINNFGPFSSDVWGTVSDWAMVIVTGSTLFYIIRTFKSQYEVQKLQQQSTNIENEKFRIHITPVFELLLIKSEFNFINDEVEIKILLDFRPIQNECLNLKIETTALDSKITSEYIPGKNLDYIALNGHRGLHLTMLAQKKMFDKHGCGISVNFNYSDIISNDYTMNFLVALTYTDNQINTMGPLRILKK